MTQDIVSPKSGLLLLPSCQGYWLVGRDLGLQGLDVSLGSRAKRQNVSDRSPANRCASVSPEPAYGNAM